jgi:hypothetical protein
MERMDQVGTKYRNPTNANFNKTKIAINTGAPNSHKWGINYLNLPILGNYFAINQKLFYR